jgi:hypothetical protein
MNIEDWDDDYGEPLSTATVIVLSAIAGAVITAVIAVAAALLMGVL